MSIPTVTIKSFDDIIKIGTTLGKNWYRGHSKVVGNLTPRIFRKSQTLSEILFNPIHEIELKTIENFKRYAPSLNIALPDQDDTLGWLFIMQHHDFPTRLLDWTEIFFLHHSSQYQKTNRRMEKYFRFSHGN
jgi:hypothetical protein